MYESSRVEAGGYIGGADLCHARRADGYCCAPFLSSIIHALLRIYLFILFAHINISNLLHCILHIMWPDT